MKLRPSQTMAYFVLSGTAVFSIVYIRYLLDASAETKAGWWVLLLMGFKTAVEIVASLYGFSFIFGSVFYLFMKTPSKKEVSTASSAAVGVIYLCCEDRKSTRLNSSHS